jgi:hypothetical protein
MADHAPDYANLTCICEFTRRLHQLHRLGGEDAIDHEFSAVCRAIWGFTLDDFTDDDLSAEDHAWLDDLTRERHRFRRGAGIRPEGLRPRRLRRRLVGLHVDDPGRGAGRAHPRGPGTVRGRGGRPNRLLDCSCSVLHPLSRSNSREVECPF